MKLYIRAANSFLNDPATNISTLKEILKNESGKSFRRINRFIYLTLIGALGLAKKTEVGSDTALYLATNYGSIASTIGSLTDVYEAKSLPMPIDFINTASNIGGFYVASELGLTAKNLCISAGEQSFEAALELAALDIESGEVSMALVGGVDETTGIFEGSLEGSCWVLVSANAAGAIGEISFDETDEGDIFSPEEEFYMSKQHWYYGSYSAFAVTHFLENFSGKSVCFVSEERKIKIVSF